MMLLMKKKKHKRAATHHQRKRNDPTEIAVKIVLTSLEREARKCFPILVPHFYLAYKHEWHPSPTPRWQELIVILFYTMSNTVVQLMKH